MRDALRLKKNLLKHWSGQNLDKSPRKTSAVHIRTDPVVNQNTCSTINSILNIKKAKYLEINLSEIVEMITEHFYSNNLAINQILIKKDNLQIVYISEC